LADQEHDGLLQRGAQTGSILASSTSYWIKLIRIIYKYKIDVRSEMCKLELVQEMGLVRGQIKGVLAI
jgi:hypothetical protein